MPESGAGTGEAFKEGMEGDERECKFFAALFRCLD